MSVLDVNERKRPSSPDMLVRRVRAVGAAFQAQDEAAAREELLALSHEAVLLAKSKTLFAATTGLERRQEVYLDSTPPKGG